MPAIPADLSIEPRWIVPMTRRDEILEHHALVMRDLDAEMGTLEPGKWADLCCLDLSGPAAQPLYDPVRQLVFSGGRDMVSDVWVAGRHLLSNGQFTRLDWPGRASRLGTPALSPTRGEVS
ncbi:MAG: hypothetical protein ACLP2F_11055 [Steroidobacteraceae bacterium]